VPAGAAAYRPSGKQPGLAASGQPVRSESERQLPEAAKDLIARTVPLDSVGLDD